MANISPEGTQLIVEKAKRQTHEYLDLYRKTHTKFYWIDSWQIDVNLVNDKPEYYVKGTWYRHDKKKEAETIIEIRNGPTKWKNEYSSAIVRIADGQIYTKNEIIRLSRIKTSLAVKIEKELTDLMTGFTVNQEEYEMSAVMAEKIISDKKYISVLELHPDALLNISENDDDNKEIIKNAIRIIRRFNGGKKLLSYDEYQFIKSINSNSYWRREGNEYYYRYNGEWQLAYEYLSVCVPKGNENKYCDKRYNDAFEIEREQQ